jgi:hypothetical protein
MSTAHQSLSQLLSQETCRKHSIKISSREKINEFNKAAALLFYFIAFTAGGMTIKRGLFI